MTSPSPFTLGAVFTVHRGSVRRWQSERWQPMVLNRRWRRHAEAPGGMAAGSPEGDAHMEELVDHGLGMEETEQGLLRRPSLRETYHSDSLLAPDADFITGRRVNDRQKISRWMLIFQLYLLCIPPLEWYSEKNNFSKTIYLKQKSNIIKLIFADFLQSIMELNKRQ